jgi:hypothetical protein
MRGPARKSRAIVDSSAAESTYMEVYKNTLGNTHKLG